MLVCQVLFEFSETANVLAVEENLWHCASCGHSFQQLFSGVARSDAALFEGDTALLHQGLGLIAVGAMVFGPDDCS